MKDPNDPFGNIPYLVKFESKTIVMFIAIATSSLDLGAYNF